MNNANNRFAITFCEDAKIERGKNIKKLALDF